MKRIALLFCVLFSASANAEPLNLSLKYDAEWSGLPVGEMRIYLQDDGKNYVYSAKLDSAGFTKMLTKYWSENTATGKITNGKHIPQKYNTEWRLKKENQKIEVVYDEAGNAIKEIAEPPENRDKRPFVELKDKKNSYDTLTAAVVARKRIIEAAKLGSFPAKISIPMFDARRKQEIDITVSGYENKRINGEKQKLLHVHFRRIPGAGFREKEIKRMETQEPVYDLYLNDEFIPVFVIGRAPVGTATLELAKICETQNCNLDEK